MRRGLFVPLAAVVAVGAAASSASAINWMERNSAIPGVDRNHGVVNNFSFGDAGESLSDFDLTAGDQPLTTITGSLTAFTRPAGASLDADVYCIRISDPANFQATASGTSSPDLNLSLFRLNGQAVAFNDNRTDSLTSLNPRLTNFGTDVNGNAVTIPGLTAGDYLLAISRSDSSNLASIKFSRPLDSGGNLIFPGMLQAGNSATDPNAGTRRADLGPITPGTVLASWELFPTSLFIFNTNYTITLSGTEHSTIPAPSAAGLLAVGVLARRRRR